MRKKELEDRLQECRDNFKRAKILFVEIAGSLGGRYDPEINRINWKYRPWDSLDQRVSMLIDYLGLEVRHDPERTYLAKKKGVKK
jgi:hypothetical protein